MSGDSDAVAAQGVHGQEHNPYLYAVGDPINRTNPTGLFSFSDILGTGSGIFGVVTGCVAGIGDAAEIGVITYVAVVGGVVFPANAEGLVMECDGRVHR